MRRSNARFDKASSAGSKYNEETFIAPVAEAGTQKASARFSVAGEHPRRKTVLGGLTARGGLRERGREASAR